MITYAVRRLTANAGRFFEFIALDWGVMSFLTELVDLLQKGGPWTISAICLLVTAQFYREMRAFQKASAEEKQALNDRLILMTVKQVEVLTISNENQKRLIEVVTHLED